MVVVYCFLLSGSYAKQFFFYEIEVGEACEKMRRHRVEHYNKAKLGRLF
jgi:hypothetical protein